MPRHGTDRGGPNMGGVIISEPEEGSPIEDLPWVIVFQSLDDSWDSFACGPYERDPTTVH